MTVEANGNIHVVWFTQIGETPRLYIASSRNHASSFGAPAVFDAAQKLAKHAHAVAVSQDQVLIAWDDLNGKSLVKWGLYNPTTKSMRILGTQQEASYPIAAASAGHFGVVALRSGQPQFFRMFF
jgi:hypothetical protein